MHPIETAAPERARRQRRSSRLTAIAAGVAIVAAGLTADIAAPASVAHAEVADNHSPTVVLTATLALAKFDQSIAARSPRGGYDQAAAFAAGTSHLEFDALRDRTAALTAKALGVDPAAMRAAWTRADTPHQVALLAALSQLGVQYRYSSSEEGVGFDCSGLTAFAWARAGTTLSRQSGSQISEVAPRDASTAVAGDLVQYPGHVMIYLGVDSAIVHAANSARDVEIAMLPGGHSVRYGDPTG